MDPFELLIEAISTVRQGLPGLMWGSVVLQTIQEQYPWFSQHNGGYESFEKLLESAQERGLITLERDSQADSYLITGFVEPAS